MKTIKKITHRKTQAERRESTKRALIQAAISCLLEDGYAAVSTRKISARAGLSQGALQYYFHGRAAMINAAISDMVRHLAEQVMLDLQGVAADELLLAEQLVDQLWAAHNTPFATVIYDIFYAARDDLEVANHISKTFSDGVIFVHSLTKMLLPELSKHPHFMTWLLLSETMMRGTIMMSQIPNMRSGFASWQVVRKQILDELNRMHMSL